VFSPPAVPDQQMLVVVVQPYPGGSFTVRDPRLHHEALIHSWLLKEILGLLLGKGPWALTLWH